MCTSIPVLNRPRGAWDVRNLVTLFLSALVWSSAAWAIDLSRPVVLLVPYPAGGPSDYVARQIEPIAAAALGQPITVENVGGASGAIGVQKVLSAVPDGQVVLMSTPMDLVLPPLNLASVKYKPEDFKLVAGVGSTSMVLVIGKDVPFSSVNQLIDAAQRAGTQQLKFGSLGPGSFYHIVAERFSQLAGITMLQVPYKGAAPLLTDLIGGQIDLAFVPLAGSVPNMIREGRLKALGVTSSVPHPSFPSIPAMAGGALKDMEFSVWVAVAVRKDVPRDVASKLHDAFYAATSDVRVRENLENSGSLVPGRRSMEELEQFYRAEISRFRSLAKSMQLVPQ